MMMNAGLIIGVIFLISLLGNAFTIYQIKHKNNELLSTKESLYDCLARNKKNEDILSDIDKKNIKFNKRYQEIQKNYHVTTSKANHEINNVLLTQLTPDCEKAIKWGAENSAKIAKNY